MHSISHWQLTNSAGTSKSDGQRLELGAGATRTGHRSSKIDLSSGAGGKESGRSGAWPGPRGESARSGFPPSEAVQVEASLSVVDSDSVDRVKRLGSPGPGLGVEDPPSEAVRVAASLTEAVSITEVAGKVPSSSLSGETGGRVSSSFAGEAEIGGPSPAGSSGVAGGAGAGSLSNFIGVRPAREPAEGADFRPTLSKNVHIEDGGVGGLGSRLCLQLQRILWGLC